MNREEFIAAVDSGKVFKCGSMTLRRNGKYIEIELPNAGFVISGHYLKRDKEYPDIVHLIYEETFAGLPYTALKGTMSVNEWRVVE